MINLENIDDLFIIIVYTNNHLQKWLREATCKYNIDEYEYKILLTIHKMDIITNKSLTVKEIASYLDLSKQAVQKKITTLLERKLLNKKYINSKTCNYSLSDLGIKLALDIYNNEILKEKEKILSSIDKKELDITINTLKAINKKLLLLLIIKKVK